MSLSQEEKLALRCAVKVCLQRMPVIRGYNRFESVSPDSDDLSDVDTAVANYRDEEG